MSGNAALTAAAAAGDRAAEAELVRRNGGLIRATAMRFRSRLDGRGLDEDDLFQLAAIGFLKAVRNFDSASGYALSTYAVPKMVGEIRRFLRDDGLIHVGRRAREDAARLCAARETLTARLGREPRLSELAAELGAEPEEVGAAAAAAGALDGALSSLDAGDETGRPPLSVAWGSEEEEATVERLALGEALAALEPRLRAVLDLRYGRGLTQTKTAAVLGMTQVQVSRAEKRAVERLRKIWAEGA